MADALAASQIKSTTWEGIVVRCGCTDAQKAAPDWHGNLNQPCPNPKKTENLGVLSFTSSNPLKQLWYVLTGRVWY